jgi:hypothetical protein
MAESSSEGALNVEELKAALHDEAEATLGRRRLRGVAAACGLPANIKARRCRRRRCFFMKRRRPPAHISTPLRNSIRRMTLLAAAARVAVRAVQADGANAAMALAGFGAIASVTTSPRASRPVRPAPGRAQQPRVPQPREEVAQPNPYVDKFGILCGAFVRLVLEARKGAAGPHGAELVE